MEIFFKSVLSENIFINNSAAFTDYKSNDLIENITNLLLNNNNEIVIDVYDCPLSIGCYLRHSIPWTVALCIAYLLVFIIGLIGNLSVLWIIMSLRRTHKYSVFNTCNKVFNGLIGNLALADLLVVIFCLPPTLIGNIFGPWILGRVICKAVPYLQGVSVSASVYTLVAISIDRFYGIYFPLNNGFSLRIRQIAITTIWLFSMIVAIPWLIYFDLVPMDDNIKGIMMCTEVWPTESASKIYYLAVNLGLQYLLPLSIIAIFYILLFIKIWKRTMPKFTRQSSEDTLSNWNKRIVEKSKIKVLKMLIVIVSLFALSWLPLYAIFARVKLGPSFDDSSTEGKFIVTIIPVAQWLGSSNSCVNPILYFFFNAKFRAYFKRTINKHICIATKGRKKFKTSGETHL